MYSERKLRYDRSTKYKIILCVLFVISALLFSDKVMAGTLAEGMKQKDIAFQLGISEAYVTQLKMGIRGFLSVIRI